ncbi:MAG: hypothetical protein QM764_12880 [Chitinophagaceae bacterium]
MKKILFRCLAGSIPLFALFGNSIAQNAGISYASFKEVPTKVYVFDEMKAEGATLINNIGDVHARALKEFSKSFKSITNASWYQMQDGGFVAKFKLGSTETRVDYDKKGRWLATVRTYTESDLPKEIRHMVKSTYYDYNIFLVQEVTVGDKTAYLVKIEDAGTFKTIRVLDGEMDEYENYNKG